MKVKFLTLLLLVLSVFTFTQCSKDASNDNVTTQDVNIAEAQDKLFAIIQETKPISRIDYEIKQAKEAPNNLSSKGLSTRSIEENYAQLAHNSDYMFYKNLVLKAINPDDYDCGPTILDDYLAPLTANWTNRDIVFFINFGNMAFDEAFLLDNKEGEDYFGDKGQYTENIQRTWRTLKKFWDAPTDIILGDAHGSTYKDIPTISFLLQVFYGTVDSKGKFTPYTAQQAAQLAPLISSVFGSAAFQNYNHPLLTFNAFQQSSVPELGVVEKIVMGDGIMRAYRDMGFGAVAEQFILGHEYGHHIQTTMGIYRSDFTYIDPEESRQFETMADAYGAYHTAHKQGINYRVSNGARVYEAAASVGDCAFTNPAHHGTPNQRERAAQFGIMVANDPYRRDERIKSNQFSRIFNAYYHHIIKPDGLKNNSNINF